MKVSLILTLVAAMLLTYQAAATCVNEDNSLAAEIKRSDTILSATVTSASSIADPEDLELIAGYRYAIKIDHLFRGPAKADMHVYSENNSSRFPMVAGASYLLFLKRAGDYFVVDNCGNSASYERSTPTIEALTRLLNSSIPDNRQGEKLESSSQFTKNMKFPSPTP